MSQDDPPGPARDRGAARIAVVLMLLMPAACVGEAADGDGADGDGVDHERRSRSSRGAAADPEGWVRAQAPDQGVLFEGVGRVVPTPGAIAHVSTPFDVRVVGVQVAPGDRVEAGDALVDVAPPEVLRAAASLAPSAARVRALEGRIELLRGLRERELVEAGRLFELETRLAEARAAFGDARATLAAAGVIPGRARALVARGRLSLEAPFPGIVSEVRAIQGQVVSAGGAPLVELIGEGHARVAARFPAALPGDEVEGLRVTFDAGTGGAAPLLWPPVGRTRAPEDGTFLAFFDATPEARGLNAGLTGVVVVKASGLAPDDHPLVEVPTDAVVLRGGTPHVLVDRGGEQEGPSAVRVEVAAVDGPRAIVRGDVAIGDRLSLDAARLLEAGRTSRGRPARALNGGDTNGRAVAPEDGTEADER